MKLQKQLSRKVGNKEYAKYVLVVPPKNVKQLGWKDGDELNPCVQGKGLVLKKKATK